MGNKYTLLQTYLKNKEGQSCCQISAWSKLPYTWEVLYILSTSN